MKDKQALVEEKTLCDLKLATIKAKLAEVKSDAKFNGNYIDPVEFRKLVLQVGLLKQRSQTIQNEIAKINVKNKSIAITDIKNCFMDAAKKVLPEKTFLEILNMAHEIKQARENYLSDD